MTRFFVLLNGFTVCCAIFLAGCSLFSGSDRPVPPEPGFRQSMAPVGKAMPLPVEIAQDIAEISENGMAVRTRPGVESAAPPVGEASSAPQSPAGAEKIAASPEDFKDRLNGPLGQAAAAAEQGPLAIKSGSRRISSTKLGSMTSYIVRLGDTLMKIAFEKMGNYLLWKEIYKVNRKKMVHYTKMQVGTNLAIRKVDGVQIRKVGKPYRIQKGDTIQTISARLYGTSDKWRALWKNNPQLIRNPQRLYAGFTLYYE